MNGSSMMLLAGPGSVFRGREFRDKLDDYCTNTNFVKQCEIVWRDSGDDQPRSLVIEFHC